MKQTNVIRVAVNPSNLIQPVRINDNVFKKKLHYQQKTEANDILSVVRHDNSEIQNLYRRPSSCSKEIYQDKSFIKSFIPKNRIYSNSIYK